MLTSNIINKFIKCGTEYNIPTYECYAAASGGTDESLVTTGEKYCWNNKADATGVNTKTFYLSGTSDLTNAQAAYDWYAAGKNPIIMYSGRAHILVSSSSARLDFWGSCLFKQDVTAGAGDKGYSKISVYKVIMNVSNGIVTSLSIPYYYADDAIAFKFLATDVNYGNNTYTPKYNGSPATKKYVDDGDSVVSGDANTTYTIKVSSSAPASGTANSVITFVTGS